MNWLLWYGAQHSHQLLAFQFTLLFWFGNTRKVTNNSIQHFISLVFVNDFAAPKADGDLRSVPLAQKATEIL